MKNAHLHLEALEALDEYTLPELDDRFTLEYKGNSVTVYLNDKVYAVYTSVDLHFKFTNVNLFVNSRKDWMVTYYQPGFPTHTYNTEEELIIAINSSLKLFLK